MGCVRFDMGGGVVMTARTWTASDPAPRDWPAVVGPDGATWGRDQDAAQSEGITGLYVRQEFRHWPEGGVTLGPAGCDFGDIFDHYEEGSEVREATADEASTWLETWPAVKS